jgi:glycyl-tRNA synthetase beta chain
VKTIAERGLRIGLRRLLLEAREVYRRQGLKFAIKDAEYEDSLASFFRERLEFYLRDVKKFDYDVVNAVLAAGSDRVLDAVTRAHAVAQVRSKTEFEAIALSFKRIKNILRQAQEKKIEFAHTPDPELAREAAESALMQQAATIGKSVEKRRTRGEYERALAEIAGLRPALDKFFDDVMVMVKDTKLRQNRLALLASILRDFSTIADFSEIVSERKS